MRPHIWLAVGGAVLALVACDAKKENKADKGDEKASSDDDDGGDDKKKGEDEKAAKKEGEAKDEPASAQEEPADCGPANQVPDIPSGRSAPPSLAEWASACEVNTQGAGSQAGDCTMKIKREWLQVNCRGNIKGYEELDEDAFGNEGSDYFKQIVPDQLASFVVRLRKGKNQKVRICREKERASLFVSWPPSSPKPTIVALGVGPKCDGSSFGTQ